MMEPGGDAGGPGVSGTGSRAFLKVGAMSLARHQLGLVLALGCERVICLAAAFEGEMIALQHIAEAAHASFYVISGTRGLASLISAADEVIVLADGLLAWPSLAAGLLDSGPVVLVQPIESGLAAGFERVDLNHAAAAAFRISGSLVERLNDLPSDADACSALQRIALQSGVPQRPLPEEAASSGRWSMVTSEAGAHALEAAWIRLHIADEGEPTPALSVARRAVRLLGPALLDAGSGGIVVAMVALVVALLGLVTGWFGYAATGFCCCAVSWVLFLSSDLLGRIERDSLAGPASGLSRIEAFGGVMDAILVVLTAWNVALAPGQGWVQRGFAPVILLGLARMVPKVVGGRWARWLGDRALLSGVLALAAAFSLTGEVVGVLTMGMLGLGIFATRARG